MIVLGLSGLPNAQEHLRSVNPDLSAIDDRLCQGLDSAACVVVDGQVVAAAAEERFTGQKGTGAIPLEAIDYCLRAAGVGAADVGAVAHGFDYDRSRRFFAASPEYFDGVLSGRTVVDALTSAGWTDVAERFHPVAHHVAHAASAYYPSGFDAALCVVSDGMGETESLSVYRADGGGFQELHKQSIASSLGILYSIGTRFLGFAFNADEYKVMGLAAYGDPERYGPVFDELARFDATTGGVVVEWPRRALRDAESGYPAAMAHLETMGLVPRRPGEELRPEHADVAAALQMRLTTVLTQLVGSWLERTGERSLCLAGGTFLNCKANEAICNLPAVEQVFVQPASSDDGTSLGAALHIASQLEPKPKVPSAPGVAFDPYLGPSFSVDEVRAELERCASGEAPGSQAITWHYLGMDNEAYFDAAAKDLADDRIVAWYSGRMEFGPRALGNRSILGLPKGDRIKERINGMVKFREPFRPFAPAVLDEDCDALFETRRLSPSSYMLCTAQVRPAGRDAISGVVHADGSARIQVVAEAGNRAFWRLLQQVKRRVGVGCVVNTSLNVKGQPLIMSPRAAIEMLLATSLDRLYIEGFIVCKMSMGSSISCSRN